MKYVGIVLIYISIQSFNFVKNCYVILLCFLNKIFALNCEWKFVEIILYVNRLMIPNLYPFGSVNVPKWGFTMNCFISFRIKTFLRRIIKDIYWVKQSIIAYFSWEFIPLIYILNLFNKYNLYDNIFNNLLNSIKICLKNENSLIKSFVLILIKFTKFY